MKKLIATLLTMVVAVVLGVGPVGCTKTKDDKTDKSKVETDKTKDKDKGK